MRYRLLLAAAMICVPNAVLPQAVIQVATPEPASMRFEWMREGPVDACGAQCREWVAASGPITGDTARDFRLFSEVRDIRNATLVLDSGGGSVLASLELGRRVRQLGMNTTVGRVARLSAGADGVERGKFSPRAECASMCVFVLLGGVQRSVPPEARILVHQIWPGSKRYDASAETYTAEEMVRIQRDVGRIAKYTVEMGGDIELFELAMRIPPWERLRSLSQTELRRLRLQSIETAAESRTSGAVTLERPLKAVRMVEQQRGWTSAGTPQQGLVRRHALTIEGEEIGQFELALGCGDDAQNFTVSYVDARAMSPDAPSERLKDVTLWLGPERVSLTVQSSTVSGDAGELKSVATGSVPPAFLDKLRQDPTSVIVVGTRTTDNVRTSIRVGATGFAGIFPRFAGACGRQATAAVRD